MHKFQANDQRQAKVAIHLKKNAMVPEPDMRSLCYANILRYRK